jgi:steroid 5-alpha reductase family enzyme
MCFGALLWLLLPLLATRFGALLRWLLEERAWDDDDDPRFAT